ncbi:hypothetical protein [Ureibacillus aquaedulcis]|uniref:Zinc ribbon domain-containing protein n=1 Tax=Ureibacillus aquaedulcis TaxID=3058421 RepID=A0ABT8GSG6_9BACL|nr:hypothetical protein [Ureibacillus sp. BA0131]MDN4494360.1 hypothetical protein [Ureibacillus sp. BA0131]
MGTLEIIILLFFAVSIIWTIKTNKSAKNETSAASAKGTSDSSAPSKENAKKKQSQKPTQVAATMSEDGEENIDYIKLSSDDYKRCNQCEKVIGVKDNFCSYCGLPNPQTN